LPRQPVKEDELADLYTNRPFGKVFDALRRVEEYLKSVFEAAPGDPFSEAEERRSLNISLGMVKRIKQLHAEGLGVKEIAQRLRISATTVRYHLAS
jgi:DNA-binding NarL/FixJ family response regulator